VVFSCHTGFSELSDLTGFVGLIAFSLSDCQKINPDKNKKRYSGII